MGYIDADKLKGLLKERQEEKDYREVIWLIDSLQQEQPVEKTSYDTQKYTPSPSVSIEDVAKVQFASHAKVFDNKRKAVFDWEQFKEIASIFYGFGKKDSSETKEKEQPDSEEKFHNLLDAMGDCGFSQDDILLLKSIWEDAYSTNKERQGRMVENYTEGRES